jgi:Tfp pilus assembly protein PilO
VKRSVLIGVAAGGVVLLLLWYFVLFAPTSSDLNDTRDQVAAAQSQKQELENTIGQLKELSANAAQQQASLRTLRAAVPPTPDLGAFILQANDIATASGIDWLSIAPTPPAATVGAGPTSTIALSMQISGGFFEVLDYLNRLEGLERVVIVDTINIAAGNTDSGGATSGSTGASGAGTSSSDSSSGGAPDLNVTLTGRMFTDAAPAPSATPGAATTPTTTPTTTPGGSTQSTTPPASSSGANS